MVRRVFLEGRGWGKKYKAMQVQSQREGSWRQASTRGLVWRACGDKELWGWQLLATLWVWESVQFSHSVLSNFATPRTAACQASLSITSSQRLLNSRSLSWWYLGKKGAPLVVGSLIIMQIQSGSMTSRQLSSENLGLTAVKLGSWISLKIL